MAAIDGHSPVEWLANTNLPLLQNLDENTEGEEEEEEGQRKGSARFLKQGWGFSCSGPVELGDS